MRYVARQRRISRTYFAQVTGIYCLLSPIKLYFQSRRFRVDSTESHIYGDRCCRNMRAHVSAKNVHHTIDRTEGVETLPSLLPMQCYYCFHSAFGRPFKCEITKNTSGSGKRMVEIFTPPNNLIYTQGTASSNNNNSEQR